MNRHHTTSLAVSISALALVPMLSTGASAAGSGLSSFDQRLLADVNAARVQHGADPLTLSNRLTPISINWAEQIADNEQATNNPHLRASLDAACPHWRRVGENVGVAGESTADDLFAVYMKNSAERHTLLDSRFTSVGVDSVATNEDGATVRWNVMDFASHCS